MDATDNVITVCTRCIDASKKTRPGAALAYLLRHTAPKGFRVEHADCLAGCGRTTVVAYSGAGKATWVFGDIDQADLPDLLGFARMYAASDDAWFRGRDCPKKLCDNTLSRVPGLTQ
jgi:predicted metal-binding protein